MFTLHTVLQVIDVYLEGLAISVRPAILMLPLPSQLACHWSDNMDERTMKEWLYEKVSFQKHLFAK